MKEVITIYVERAGVGDEIPVDVEFNVTYERGEYLERNHPMNGYGAGYEVEYIKHTGIDGELLQEELEDAGDKLLQECGRDR